jgi:mono/diheme cytochrome c family protein
MGTKKIPGIMGVFVLALAVLVSCSDIKRKPGRVYMPDMAYSRAYETYSVTPEMREALEKKGIHFSNVPVPGTIKRGAMLPFLIPKDALGDSTNYVASKLVPSPLESMDSLESLEAQRLFLVNCAICHGTKMDGNGPLYKGGDGPFAAKPANLLGDPKIEAMPVGQMYYSVTYGKNKMGSYASQLDTRQRWMVISYIKTRQAESKATNSPHSSDSTVIKK